MANIQDYKCPNCAGQMVFSASTQKLKCEYCDTEMSVEEFEELDAVLHAESVETDYGTYQGETLGEMQEQYWAQKKNAGLPSTHRLCI